VIDVAQGTDGQCVAEADDLLVTTEESERSAHRIGPRGAARQVQEGAFVAHDRSMRRVDEAAKSCRRGVVTLSVR
jgi:hypothetical protein